MILVGLVSLSQTQHLLILLFIGAGDCDGAHLEEQPQPPYDGVPQPEPFLPWSRSDAHGRSRGVLFAMLREAS